MKKIVLLFTLLTSFLYVGAAEAQWVDLFNGKDLTGWTKRGGSNEYRVENAAIVGKTIEGSPSSYLCTDKKYTNFILECEFKVSPGLNAGIQFRTEFEPKKGGIRGYQAEIDMDPIRGRWWSLGLFDQGGPRKWLFPGLLGGERKAFSDQGRLLSKSDDWNQAKIVCEGDRIQMWLNGELRVDTRDPGTHEASPSTGFIALQIHHVKSDGTNWVTMECAWRNIRIQELP